MSEENDHAQHWFRGHPPMCSRLICPHMSHLRQNSVNKHRHYLLCLAYLPLTCPLPSQPGVGQLQQERINYTGATAGAGEAQRIRGRERRRPPRQRASRDLDGGGEGALFVCKCGGLAFISTGGVRRPP